mmetsp:Transcript_29569/g.55323  ORF Transcript_29569/g.55323 Transcript_29569/m.55323 type:complete len:267 (+) Transcript_29569:103-903(+)
MRALARRIRLGGLHDVLLRVLLLALGRLGGRLGRARLDDGVGLEDRVGLVRDGVAHVLGGEVGVGVVHGQREHAGRLGEEVTGGLVDLLGVLHERCLLVLVALPLHLEGDIKRLHFHDPQKLAPVLVIALHRVHERVARGDALGHQVLGTHLVDLDAFDSRELLRVFPAIFLVQYLGVHLFQQLALVTRRVHLYLLSRVRVDEVLHERIQRRKNPRAIHAVHVLHNLRVVLLVTRGHDLKERDEVTGLEAGTLHINDASNLVDWFA